MVWKIVNFHLETPSNPRNLLATFDYQRVTMKSCGFPNKKRPRWCVSPGAPSELLAAISCAGAKPLWTTPTIQRFRTSSGKNPMVDPFLWIHFFPKFDFAAQVFAGVMARHQIQGVEATAVWKNNSWVYIYIYIHMHMHNLYIYMIHTLPIFHRASRIPSPRHITSIQGPPNHKRLRLFFPGFPASFFRAVAGLSTTSSTK